MGDADELQWLEATNALWWIDPAPGTAQASLHLWRLIFVSSLAPTRGSASRWPRGAALQGASGWASSVCDLVQQPLWGCSSLDTFVHLWKEDDPRVLDWQSSRVARKKKMGKLLFLFY